MILCPNCHHEEISGALFCSECGANLIHIQNHGEEETVPQEPSEFFDDTAIPEYYADLGTPDDANISLYFMDKDQRLPLADREDYTLGRVNVGQPVIPDIDLTPYGAYEGGVSRLHATISVGPPITVTDLGSINGTQLNGEKINPNEPHLMSDGDILTLGRMRIKVLIRK
jgi:pSer/pThr/pTyr-binding forkhead associated (FHA) protein